MATVFIETTIPSFYFEGRTSIQSRAWREATRSWWTKERHRHELVTSQYVLDELALAPPAKRDPGLRLMETVAVLPDPPGLVDLIDHYVANKLVPSPARGDAAHLAFATLVCADVLLTWNCRHLANANKVPHLRTINTRLGLNVPTLATPYALIDAG